MTASALLLPRHCQGRLGTGGPLFRPALTSALGGQLTAGSLWVFSIILGACGRMHETEGGYSGLENSVPTFRPLVPPFPTGFKLAISHTAVAQVDLVE